MEQLLRVDEVARILRVARSTAYGLVARGDLPSIRISKGVVRVDPEDLRIFLDRRRDGGVPD